jgi:site-specific recombinase XerD
MCGKAAMQRLVPLNGIVREALDKYLIARAKAPRGQSNVLFFAMRNRYALKTIEPISVRSIRRMLL